MAPDDDTAIDFTTTTWEITVEPNTTGWHWRAKSCTHADKFPLLMNVRKDLATKDEALTDAKDHIRGYVMQYRRRVTEQAVITLVFDAESDSFVESDR